MFAWPLRGIPYTVHREGIPVDRLENRLGRDSLGRRGDCGGNLLGHRRTGFEVLPLDRVDDDVPGREAERASKRDRLAESRRLAELLDGGGAS